MKDNKIISNIKTAGVVATAAFTMMSCGRLSEAETQIVQHKTDSAAKEHIEYRMASNVLDICESRIKGYRDANKTLVKMYSRDYIQHNEKDFAARNFMISALEDTALMLSTNSDSCTSDSIEAGQINSMRYIRRTQRWFNDVLLYLSDKYTEEQFLKSEFFNVINDMTLRKNFERNMKHIEEMHKAEKFAINRKEIIYGDLWNQYAKEVKKQR